MKKNNRRGEALRSLVGLNIKRFRINSGFSQEDLAEKSGISVPYLGAIERGEKWPSPAIFAEIALSLTVDPSDLLKPENATAQDVKKITTKLVKDITVLVNQAVNTMSTFAK